MLSTDSPYLSQKELWAFGIQENEAEPSKSPLLRNSAVLQSQLPPIHCPVAAGEAGCAQSTSQGWDGDAPGAVRTVPYTSKSGGNVKLVNPIPVSILWKRGFLAKESLVDVGTCFETLQPHSWGGYSMTKARSPSGRRKIFPLQFV